MKTEDHAIHDVLAKNATSFFIPPFQRAYAWGKSEIERYFSDIVRIIRSELDAEQRDKLEHFLGTLVIKEETAGRADISIVVDGQQRLTTTLLFLIALRDSESDDENTKFITNTYLINNTSTFEDKIKLKQVTKDWDAYKALVTQTSPQPERSLVCIAYKQFKKLILETKRTIPEIQFDHYINAIKKMNVAVIFLDERPHKGEDPQIIFETLNSLGKLLSLSDLVRNFVLLQMDSRNQSDIYENHWHPRIEAILDENASEFFRDYLQYKTARSIKGVDNNTKEIYQQFRDFVEKAFENRKEFIEDIVRYVPWYTWIITEEVSDTISSQKDVEIKELLRNIFHDIKSGPFKPFVLGLLEYHQSGKMSDETLIAVLESIRVYLIRRRVLGLTQGENKAIVTLSDQIEDLSNGTVTLFTLLSDMFYKVRLPNDKEIIEELKTKNFYEELKTYLNFILGKIEEHTTKAVIDFRKLRIELIMPQDLNHTWKTVLGDDWERIHKEYVHNIGNLRLTDGMRNKSLYDKWTEADLKKRQSNMIKGFLETFPVPAVFQTANNWNTSIQKKDSFSPLDSDAGDSAEGNKPDQLRIYDKKVSVKTWQDVFLSFIRYIKEKFDFGTIHDNQISLFKKEIILPWAKLDTLINEDPNNALTNRYKTLEGKTWEKVKNPADCLFFHVHISASQCVTRIATIMNQFSMEEDSVEIVLKHNE
jgi:uncharacterized protein with ParB-like and HNH nuclease domain